jgi:hypothetical protein
MVSAELPDDLNQILEYIAMMAKVYSSGLKWNEVAKLKSDMMKVRERWAPHRAPVQAVRVKCLESGMSAQDTDTVIDLLRKTQAGKRLVPQRTYRDFKVKPLPSTDRQSARPGQRSGRPE